MKWMIKQFPKDYTLSDAPRWERPHALLDDDQTKITKHTDKNPGMSVCCVVQELGHKSKLSIKRLKKEGYFPYQVSVLHELKLEDYTPHYNYCDWFFEKFGRNVEKTKITFFQTKFGFICRNMLIRKINISGRQIIHIFSKKLRYSQLKSTSGAQFLNIEPVCMYVCVYIYK